MRNKFIFRLGIIILTIITILVGKNIVDDYLFLTRSIKKEATIVDYKVNARKTLFKKSHYIVDVEYFYDNHYITNKLDDYNKHPQPNDKIIIYIDKEDSNNIRSNINYIRSFVIIFILAIGYIILIFPNMTIHKLQKQIRKLRKSGAIVVNANINNASYLDDDYCDDKYWALSCNGIVDNNNYEFKSIKLPFNTKSYFHDNDIKTIDVYVLKNDPNIYCVDVLEVLKYNPKK